VSLLVASGRSSRDLARRRASELQALLEQDIDQGRLRPGEKIATERELASRFGASRSVVRNALSQLHKAGKIDRKVGHGTIVLAQPGQPPTPQPLSLPDASPRELMEFRVAFEPSLAEAIVLNATEREIHAILECVDKGNQVDGWEQWEQCDRAFHLSLALATHNRLTLAVYQAVNGIRQQLPWLRIKKGHTDLRRWRAYQDQHLLIAKRLAERDAAGAAEAIRDHLNRARVQMLGTDA